MTDPNAPTKTVTLELVWVDARFGIHELWIESVIVGSIGRSSLDTHPGQWAARLYDSGSDHSYHPTREAAKTALEAAVLAMGVAACPKCGDAGTTTLTVNRIDGQPLSAEIPCPHCKRRASSDEAADAARFRSWQYKAAIYFVVATLHFYRDDLLPLTPMQTLGDFADANQVVIQRIVVECLEYLGYELSHEQIGRAVQAYLAGPAKLFDADRTQPPTPNERLAAAWWNGLSEQDRHLWMRRAGNTDRVVDAWAAFKRETGR